jgi:hypothetical protein
VGTGEALRTAGARLEPAASRTLLMADSRRELTSTSQTRIAFLFSEVLARTVVVDAKFQGK